MPCLRAGLCSGRTCSRRAARPLEKGGSAGNDRVARQLFDVSNTAIEREKHRSCCNAASVHIVGRYVERGADSVMDARQSGEVLVFVDPAVRQIPQLFGHGEPLSRRSVAGAKA